MRYLFFNRPLCGTAGSPEAPAGLTLECWHPTLTCPVPPGLASLPFLLWTGFHYLGLFATRDYGVVLLRLDGRLVHRTCVLPAYFRVPFMGRRDLQAAGIWTAEDQRGRGLGLLALQEVLRHWEHPDRVLWYMAHEENQASLRLAEKAGFRHCGRGARMKRFGLGLLASYRITETLTVVP